MVADTEVTLTQRVDVWDRVDPVISTSPAQFTFEGTIFGGTSIQVESYRQQMLDALDFSDACDNPTELVEPEPVLWPVGQTTPVTWTVLDPGPNDQSGRADRRNAASVVQMVTVVDTIPPTLRTPVPLAREVPAGTTGTVAVSPDPPEVFDFVDATPQLVNDGPPGDLYPVGQTSITWTATDQSGNTSQATQIVNVKEEGTNIPPVADARTGGSAVAAQSFTEVQVPLTGSDADSDPLSFRIVDPPDDGFFVAPLLPYFFGDARAEEVTASRCAADGRGEADLFDPQYVTATDAGFTYFMNAARDCSDPSLFHRITVFDRDRNFVVARDMPRTGDFFKTFHLDERQGFISYTSNLNTVSKLDLLTLQTIAEYQAPDSYAKKAIFDKRQGREVPYITGQDTQNRGKIDVYDVTGLDLLPGVPVLGPAELVASFDVGEGAPAGPLYNVLDMAIDSGGHFYASSLGRRIQKFEPFGVDANGEIVVGDEIGWLGSCLGGSDCDALNQVSRGYSCSFATCTIGGVLPSQGLGQLGALGGMAISPTDLLYVAEFGNDRVQRFTPEGFYAGHARSTCGDDELCFVLGQFGKPNAVGVNSSNFFVLDRTLDVVHIFDTSVVELVGPGEGLVTYKSDSGFFGASDSFQFVADDGFDQSAPASVEIDVQRGFNPAVAKPDALFQLDEDTPTRIRLDGLDPDFPLDALVFAVTRQPEHGSLTPAPGGDSGDWIYTPDPDFHGDDSLDFTVDDGSGPSTPETLYLRVLPVNDDPVLGASSGAADAGRGYPYFFQFFFDDVEFDGVPHVATIDWGDGTVVGTCAPADPACDGARIIKLAQPGVVAATHVYTGFGPQQIEYCIRDEESPDVCSSFFVNATPMADFASDIVNENTQVPVGGELSFDFVVSHQPTTGVVGPAVIDGVLLVVEYDDGLDLVVASPPRGTCEFDQRPGRKATLCNIGPMAEGETLVIPVTYSVVGPAQEIRAEVQSSLPDPNGALARQPMELIDDDLARMAALGGSAEGGTLKLKVAGVALNVPMSPAESREDVAQALVEAVNGDSTLSALRVTAQASGGLVELSEPIQSLVLDEGGIERGEPVPFQGGQLTLDLDSLGVFQTTLSRGTAWVDSAGDVSLAPGAIGAIDAAATPPAGPPEIAALQLAGAAPGGGTLGSALPLYPLRLAGELTLDRSDSPVDAVLPLSVLGADDGTFTSEGSGSDFTLLGEPWSVDGFESDGFVAGQGVTHTRSYQGADDRDVLGNGPLQVVAPVTLEVYLDQSLVEVVPGGAALRLELVPEPAATAGTLALLAALAGLRARRRSRGRGRGRAGCHGRARGDRWIDGEGFDS